MKLDGQKLQRLRMKRDLTQQQLSDLSGVSLPTYNRAENGKEIQPLIAQRIANAFEVDIDDLQIPALPEPSTEEAVAEVINELKSQETA